MSTPVNFPRFKAFDSNGVPLAGGKLYTYEAGTDTPLALYQDRNFATPHAKPIVLDSNGEALIYAKAPFKAELKDSDGVTIDGWPIDYLEFPPYHSYLVVGPTVPSTPDANTIAMYAVGTAITFKDSAGTITTPIASSGLQAQSYTAAAAGGTANAITATFNPTLTALTDKLRVTVTSTAANTGPVTFAPDSLSPKPILDGSGTALVAGAIAAANIPLALQYVLALDSWVLRDAYPSQFHPSAAKAWVKVTGAGTPAIPSGGAYNVASITDSGVGTFIVVFTIPFSSAHYGIAGMCDWKSGVYYGAVTVSSANPPAAANCPVIVNAVGTPADLDYWFVSFFGDQ